MLAAWVCTASTSAANLTPPALPRPPVCTWAFTITGVPNRSAAATASCTVVTASPGDTGIPYDAKNCFP